MSVAEKLEIWRLLRAGTSFRVIGRQLGRSDATIQQYVGLTGGVQPRERCRAANQLSLGEREEISRGMAAGESVRAAVDVEAGVGDDVAQVRIGQQWG